MTPPDPPVDESSASLDAVTSKFAGSIPRLRRYSWKPEIVAQWDDSYRLHIQWTLCRIISSPLRASCTSSALRKFLTTNTPLLWNSSIWSLERRQSCIFAAIPVPPWESHSEEAFSTAQTLTSKFKAERMRERGGTLREEVGQKKGERNTIFCWETTKL